MDYQRCGIHQQALKIRKSLKTFRPEGEAPVSQGFLASSSNSPADPARQYL